MMGFITKSAVSPSDEKSSNMVTDLKQAFEEDVSKTTTKSRVYTLASVFIDQTSLHGLKQISINGVYFIKFLWLWAFVAAFGGNVYHISTLVQNYMLYPVQEVTSLEQKASRFPGVTICNQDAFSSSNRAEILEDKTSELYKYDQKLRRMMQKGIITSVEYHQMMTAGNVKQNVGREELKKLGHQAEDFIISCQFRGQTCNVSERFQLLTTSFMYNCYTFEAGDRAKNFLSTGAENGLSVILYLEANNGTVVSAPYDRNTISGNDEGAHIVIHPHRHLPTPHSQGIDILPGHSTTIGYRVQEVIKLGEPYGDCFDNYTAEAEYENRYHPVTCTVKCQTAYLIEMCGCKTPWQSFSDRREYDHVHYCRELLDGDEREVLARVKQKSECSYQHWDEFETNVTMRNEFCDCPPRCSDVMYPYSTSMSKWPAEKFMAGFIESEIPEDSKAYRQLRQAILESRRMARNPDYSFIRDNFVRVSIRLEDTQMQHREQTPSYLISNLFSDMGGTFGLWIGLSTLTILEVVQLVVQLVLVLSGKSNFQ